MKTREGGEEWAPFEWNSVVTRSVIILVFERVAKIDCERHQRFRKGSQEVQKFLLEIEKERLYLSARVAPILREVE